MSHLCHEDKEEFATCCCSCHIPPLPLCHEHGEKHKNSPGFHFLLPLEAIHQIQDPATQDAWESWFRHLAGNYKLVNSQGPAFAACRDQVEAAFQEIVATAASEKERLLFSINRAEEKLVEAGTRVEEELRQHVLDPSYPERASAFHKQVWEEDLRLSPLVDFSVKSHTESVIKSALQVSLKFGIAGLEDWSIAPSASLEGQAELNRARETVASLEARVSELEQQLSAITPKEPAPQNLTRSQSQVFATPVLACVTNEIVSFFNFETLKWKTNARFRSKIKCDLRSAFVPLNDSEVLVCGGGEPYNVWDSAYLVTIAGKIFELPHLKFARYELSVVNISGTVYALGGQDKKNNRLEVEMLESISAKQWEIAGELLQQRLFSGTAVWRELIYLCGGKESNTVEAFNPSTHLSILLPFTLSELGYAQALVLDDQLVVLSRNFVLKVNRQGESTVIRSMSNENRGSNACPVAVGDYVFYVQPPWCYWSSTTTWKKGGETRIKTPLW